MRERCAPCCEKSKSVYRISYFGRYAARFSKERKAKNCHESRERFAARISKEQKEIREPSALSSVMREKAFPRFSHHAIRNGSFAFRLPSVASSLISVIPAEPKREQESTNNGAGHRSLIAPPSLQG